VLKLVADQDGLDAVADAASLLVKSGGFAWMLENSCKITFSNPGRAPTAKAERRRK
jgi:hypothetical protein